ncbi:hypothetical protein AN958_03644 [Leucoagaricus sp. SymC.cos]|nr:hypothetical protein AN958_03644 [Leucoagaricus sp. SymC.cos]
MPSIAPYHRDSDNESDTSGSEGYDEETNGQFAVHSTSDDVEPLQQADFPSFFNEINGRLYHSSPTCPYPLPVDTPEQERLNDFNDLIYQLIGANYVGPVPHVLARDPDVKAEVLDLCTGNGRWVMQIASEFPQVLFTGIDIVPIATRYPLPNVNFEIGDISEEFRWNSATYDFVHARSISMSVHNYASILPEVSRVMRRGGLYLSGELDLRVFFHPESPEASNPQEHAPMSTQFFQLVDAALQARGIQTSIPQIPTYLQDAGTFHNIHSQIIPIPVGGWHNDLRLQEIGTTLQENLRIFAESVKPLLRSAGHSEAYVETLAENFCAELEEVEGLYAAYYIVQAFRS